MKKKFCLALVFASALTAAACGIGNRSSENPDGINENGVLESLSELFDEDTDQIRESAGAAESDIPAEETENREDGEEFSYAHVEAPNILMGDNNQGEYENYVLGSEIERDQISSVTVLDTLSDISDMSWDVSANKDGSVMAWVTADPDESGFYDLFIAGEGGVKANPDCRYLFAGYENAESINFHDCFDTSDVTTMAYMFYNCKKAKQIDVSGFDTSGVADMQYMFSTCENILNLEIEHFDTSQVTTFAGMFFRDSSLETLNVAGFDTANAEDFSSMFSSCVDLPELDVSGFDTGKATNLGGMFANCNQLTRIDVSNFDTGNVKRFNDMFKECVSLTALDLSSFRTSNAEEMSVMFIDCKNLKQIDVSSFDTSGVTDMSSMFRSCTSLETVDLSGFDTSNVNNFVMMFYGCGNLVSVGIDGLYIREGADTTDMYTGTRWQ